MNQPTAGWYEDPQDPTRHRYWDGQQWTSHVSGAEATTADRTSPSERMATGVTPPPTPVVDTPSSSTAESVSPDHRGRVSQRMLWVAVGVLAGVVAVAGGLLVRGALLAGADEDGPATGGPANVTDDVWFDGYEWWTLDVSLGSLSATGWLDGESVHFTDMVAGGQGLLAVGQVGESRWDGDPVVLRSADGVRWSEVAIGQRELPTGDGATRLSAIVAGGPGHVIVGSTPAPNGSDDQRVAAVWTSVDGRTWERVPHDEAVFGGLGWQHMEDVVAAGPGLVAVGWDDLGWDAGPYPDDPDVAFSRAAVWTSVDGLTWERVSGHDDVFDGRRWPGMRAVAAAASGLVAVGDDGYYDEDGAYQTDARIWMSRDGLSWESARLPGEAEGASLLDVAAGGGRFVAVGRSAEATAWVSGDGRSWRPATMDHSDSISAMRVIAVDGGYLAVGGESRSDGQSVVWSSRDGVDWRILVRTDREGRPGVIPALRAVTLFDGRVVTAGTDRIAIGAAPQQ